MSRAKVLYVHVTGVSSESMKNLVLAGIRAVVYDPRPLDEVRGTPSIFLPTSASQSSSDDDDGESSAARKKLKYASVAEAVQSKIEELNPLLGTCEIVPSKNNEPAKSSAAEDILAIDGDGGSAFSLSEFQIVVASRITIDDAISLSNKVVKEYGNQFYVADSFGMYGGCAFDLGPEHTYRPEKGKELLDPKRLADDMDYVPLETMLTKVSLSEATNRFHKKHPPVAWMLYRCMLQYATETNGSWPCEKNAPDFAVKTRDWLLKQPSSESLLEHELLSERSLTDLAKVGTTEISPVCAVLGGVIGNEVIKAISGKGVPANNTVLFDGLSCKAWTFLVKPKEGAGGNYN